MMREEYAELRSVGFPIVLTAVADAIETGELIARPSEWWVTGPS